MGVGSASVDLSRRGGVCGRQRNSDLGRERMRNGLFCTSRDAVLRKQWRSRPRMGRWSGRNSVWTGRLSNCV